MVGHSARAAEGVAQAGAQAGAATTVRAGADGRA
jgi:hypothetical protein